VNTKEAVKWILDIWHEWENVYGMSREISLEEGKKMDEVIELLKRGEKYEQMWRELSGNFAIKHFYWLWDNSKAKEKKIYLGETLNDLEQKYLLEEER